ncbi:MAG: hypothetical protein AAFP19_13005 [Bacteroidota bacterium]
MQHPFALALCLSLLCFTPAHSQTIPTVEASFWSKIDWGLAIGRIRSNFDEDRARLFSEFSSEELRKKSYSVGLLGSYPLIGRLLSLESGLTYRQKGDPSINLHFVQVPITLDLNLFPKSEGGLLIKMGIYNSILVHQKAEEFEHGGIDRHDAGFILGLNMKAFRTRQLQLECWLQRTIGLMRSFKEGFFSPGGNPYTISTYNSTFEFGIIIRRLSQIRQQP